MAENRKERTANDDLNDESSIHKTDYTSDNDSKNQEYKVDKKVHEEDIQKVFDPSQESESVEESNSQHNTRPTNAHFEAIVNREVSASISINPIQIEQNISQIESVQDGVNSNIIVENVLDDNVNNHFTDNNSGSNVNSNDCGVTPENHNDLIPPSTSNNPNIGNEHETTDNIDEEQICPAEPEILHSSDRLVVATLLTSDQLIYEARQEAEVDETCCTFVLKWSRVSKETRCRILWTILFLLVVTAIVMIGVLASSRTKNPSNNSSPNEENILQITVAVFSNLFFGIINSDDFDLFEILSMTTSPSSMTANTSESGLDGFSISTTSPTLSPTVSQAPSSELLFQRTRNITKIIQSVSPTDSFQDPFSSQSRALNWILYEDNLNVNSSYPTLAQRYALKVLFYDLNGENWIDKTGYVSDTLPLHECEWFGIICDENLREPKRLRFQSNGLTGKIPEEISLLTNLTGIYMYQNSINGTLPESLYSLIQLETIQLQGNILKGTLSTNIGKLKSLSTFSVRSNLLTGTLPSELGNLTTLTSCRIYSNLFSGSFPAFFANNRNLRILNFGDNNLEGTLSPSFGNLTELANLYFYENNFVGTIPSEWGGLTSLRNTGFWTNQLNGTIPNEFLQLPNLKDLSIGRNNFTGPLPISTKLEELWIYKNLFNGSIPTEIGTMTSLKVLQSWNNDFSQQLPSEIGNLKSIVTLQFARNKLSGTIPETVVGLKRMIVMNLAQNNLTGLIPSNLTNLPVLNSVDLHANNFSGTMPIDFCDKFMNRLTSDCENLNCTCCTCCYGEGDQPIYGEC